MATAKKVSNIKIPRRAAKVYNPLSADEKYTGSEPVWDTERAMKFDDAVFDSHLRKSLNFYNYFYTTKSSMKHLVEWLRRSNKVDKQTLESFTKSADRYTPQTACSLAMAAKAGMPLKDKHVEFILKCVAKAISKNDSEDNEPTTGLGYKPVVVVAKEQSTMTIQDRLNEKLSEFIGELEGRFDDVWTNQPTVTRPFDYFKTENIPQALVNKIKNHFQDRSDQLGLLQINKEADYKEAYGHFKAADWRRVQAWLTSVQDDCDSYAQVKKVARKPRIPRSVPKEKLVSKMKFQADDKILNLVSIKPVDIIGATELWCYDTKTRKIGKYIADSHSGSLGVKGTTITGFDTSKSVAKTLRKPSDQLKAFAKCSKPQLRKFMETISTTETQLSGRINDRTILLKIA